MDAGLDPEARKAALSGRLAAARIETRLAKDALAEKVNVKKRVKSSVRENPAPWVVGAATAAVLGGLLVKKMVTSKPSHVEKEEAVKKGVLKGTIASIALSLAKPYVRRLLIEKTSGFFNKSDSAEAQSSYHSGLGADADL